MKPEHFVYGGIAAATIVAIITGGFLYRSIVSGGQTAAVDSAIAETAAKPARAVPARPATPPAPEPTPMPAEATDRLLTEEEMKAETLKVRENNALLGGTGAFAELKSGGTKSAINTRPEFFGRRPGDRISDDIDYVRGHMRILRGGYVARHDTVALCEAVVSVKRRDALLVRLFVVNASGAVIGENDGTWLVVMDPGTHHIKWPVVIPTGTKAEDCEFVLFAMNRSEAKDIYGETP